MGASAVFNPTIEVSRVPNLSIRRYPYYDTLSMSQPEIKPENLEGGEVDSFDPQLTPDTPGQGESKFGDSSGQLFSMYSKAAEEEDNNVILSSQKDADGILIFTGLFSASLAVFISVSVQDLRPTSQDTSAFYLGNIYGVLANPNTTPSSSVPVPNLEPPPFSPPLYAIWVNALWFLSFVLSLICALLATLLQQWARRYTRVTQPTRCGPEKRARMRAFFSHGANKLDSRSIVERLPMLLHLSLFLFLAGLGIYLYNLNRVVFSSVIWLIVLFSTGYALIALMPTFMIDSPFFTPLSNRLFRITHMTLALITVPFALFVPSHMVSDKSKERFLRWFNRRIRWASGGVEKGADEIVLERSWEFDLRILRWSIGALANDDALENFFEAIPGFFNSKLVKHLQGNFPEHLLNRFWNVLNGFVCRTLSSNLVAVSDKAHRLDIGLNAMNVISKSRASSASTISYDVLVSGWDWDQVPQLSEVAHGQLLEHCTSDHEINAHYAQCVVAKILASTPERDDHWIRLATNAFGLSERDLREYMALGSNSVSVAISIHLIRQSIRCRFYDWDALKAFPVLDIRSIHIRLKHEFCALWNEIVHEARKQKRFSPPVRILRWSYRHHVALHQGTAPTRFTSPIDPFDSTMLIPSTYPLCTDPPISDPLTVPSHHGRSSSRGSSHHSHQHTPRNSSVSRHAEEVNAATRPPSRSDPMTINEMRETAKALAGIPPTFSLNSSPLAHVPSASPSAASGNDDSDRDQNQTNPMNLIRRHSARQNRSPRRSPQIMPSLFDILMNSLKRDGSTDMD